MLGELADPAMKVKTIFTIRFKAAHSAADGGSRENINGLLKENSNYF